MPQPQRPLLPEQAQGYALQYHLMQKQQFFLEIILVPTIVYEEQHIIPHKPEVIEAYRYFGLCWLGEEKLFYWITNLNAENKKGNCSCIYSLLGKICIVRCNITQGPSSSLLDTWVKFLQACHK